MPILVTTTINVVQGLLQEGVRIDQATAPFGSDILYMAVIPGRICAPRFSGVLLDEENLAVCL
jgi:hypothetical protein